MAINSRDPWQEPLPSRQTVEGPRSLQAAEVIGGFLGSWAGSWSLNPAITEALRTETPGTPRFKFSHLGVPGFPELNFAPYAHNTNRIGSRGGSLIGHPISFSVVGPTIKNAATTWEWRVQQGASQDKLTLRNAGGVTIPALYGFSDLSKFPGGLYLVITQTGASGELEGSLTGGLGDGARTMVTGTYGPLAPIGFGKYEIFRVTSIDDGNTSLTLDSGKRLSTYFTFPGTANFFVRSIMLLQPAATRLVAVPQPGQTKGHEQVFAVVPPERALNQDELFPYMTWTRTDASGTPLGGTWTDPLLTDYAMAGGEAFEYRYQPALPVPQPAGMFSASLPDTPILTGTNRFSLVSAFADGFSSDLGEMVGRIVHLYEVEKRDGGDLITGVTTGFQVRDESLLGWFEVVAGAENSVVLRKMDEVDPDSGRAYTLAPGYFTSTVSDGVKVIGTWHEPVSALWRMDGDIAKVSHYHKAHLDALEATRLTNIINPDWVARNPKEQLSRFDNPARADKAVFDTASANAGAAGSNANPGSLFDLGFRMVLFPAKVATVDVPGGTESRLIPDWDNPITSNEIVLDPSKPEEKQYIDIDYSNGLVRLSHAPQEGSPVYPASGVFTAGDNPRGELVLFASCVPYSMEPGQLGASLRVTAAPLGEQDDLLACELVESLDPDGSKKIMADVWSNRQVMPLTGSQTITSQQVPGSSIKLAGDWRFRLPSSGFIEILQGTTLDEAEPLFSDEPDWIGSTFGYYGVTYDGTDTTLTNVYGGGEDGTTFDVDAQDATPPYAGDGPAIAVLRRDAWGPNSPDGAAGVEFSQDVTFGASKRNGTLRFEGATLQTNPDGSMTVKVNQPSAKRELRVFRDHVWSSWILDGGDVDFDGAVSTPGGGDPYVDPTIEISYEEMLIVMRGVTMTVPAGEVLFDVDGGTLLFHTESPTISDVYVTGKYLYVEHTDGTICPEVKVASSLPLPHPEDILLWKFSVKYTITTSGGLVTAIAVLQETDDFPYPSVDLRNPLKDVDRRLDIYCGQWGPESLANWDGFSPHFLTLREAIAYASEVSSPWVGDSTRKARILVIGRTMETDVSYIGSDGLIIESMPRQKFGKTLPSDYDPEICWDSIQGGSIYYPRPLINLNGHKDVTFRNLTFRYLGSAGDGNPPSGVSTGFTHVGAYPIYQLSANGVTFLPEDAIISGLTIENCRVNGRIDGMLAIYNGVLAKSRIFGNQATNVRTAGIYFGVGHLGSAIYEPATLDAEDVFIEGNTFTQAEYDTILVLNNDNVIAGQTITINGQVLTAVAGAPGVGQFQIGAGPGSTATNIETAVNAHATLSTLMEGKAVGPYVILTKLSDDTTIAFTTNSSGIESQPESYGILFPDQTIEIVLSAWTGSQFVSDGDTITIDGPLPETFEAVLAAPTGNEFEIGIDVYETADNLAAVLNANTGLNVIATARPLAYGHGVQITPKLPFYTETYSVTTSTNSLIPTRGGGFLMPVGGHVVRNVCEGFAVGIQTTFGLPNSVVGNKITGSLRHRGDRGILRDNDVALNTYVTGRYNRVESNTIGTRLVLGSETAAATSFAWGGSNTVLTGNVKFGDTIADTFFIRATAFHSLVQGNMDESSGIRIEAEARTIRIVNNADVVAGDIVSINGVDLEAGTDFAIGASANDTADNLENAIDVHADLIQQVSATVSTDTVSLSRQTAALTPIVNLTLTNPGAITVAYRGANPIVLMGNMVQTFTFRDRLSTDRTSQIATQAVWPRAIIGNSADTIFGTTTTGSGAADLAALNIQDG